MLKLSDNSSMYGLNSQEEKLIFQDKAMQESMYQPYSISIHSF